MNQLGRSDSTRDKLARLQNRVARNMYITRLIFLAFGFLLISTGCENFQHPLGWEISQNADELVGNWDRLDGDQIDGIVKVAKTDDGFLRVEVSDIVTNLDPQRTDKEDKIMKFDAQLLASNDVNVLQIHMDTYSEKDGDGNLKFDKQSGFRFLLIDMTDTNTSLEVRSIDKEQLGRIADTELEDSAFTLSGPEFGSCISDELQVGFLLSALQDLHKDEEDGIELDSVLLEEIAEGAFQYENSSFDPFEELNSIRTCVSRKLPGADLEFLFEHHADSIFVGNVIQLRRAAT